MKVTNLEWEIKHLGIRGSIFDWPGIIEKAGTGSVIPGNLKAQAVLSALEQNHLIWFCAKEVEILEDGE